jgi:hypothetical protein
MVFSFLYYIQEEAPAVVKGGGFGVKGLDNKVNYYALWAV